MQRGRGKEVRAQWQEAARARWAEMHARSLDEDAKVGRLHHRLVAEGRAVGVRGARFVFPKVGELPHPLRKVPGACVCARRGQPERWERGQER